MRASSSRMLAAAGAVLLAAAGAGAGNTVRAGTVASITVDGETADWSGVPVVYVESGPRVTAVAHDGSFLYLYFRFSDLALARHVLRSGAIVWLNPTGKHEADFGVRYRGTEDAQRALAAMEDGGGAPPPGGTDTARQRTDGPSEGGPPPGEPGDRGPRRERAPLGALELIHYGVSDDVIAEGAKPDGPAAACKVADGTFTYEFRIPFADAAEGDASVKTSGKRTVALGFQMGGLTPAERDAMRERAGTDEGRGGGRPEGGSPGGFGGGSEGGGFGGGGRPGGYGGGHGGRGGQGGFGDGAGRSRAAARSSEPVWLDVELVDAPAATTAAR